tara:strand:- start:4030 stop:4806 length:777 start_codon:yes stop_codon:yes gene_type:complete
MKIISTTVAVMALATTAHAADLTGSIELDIKENAAGNFVATQSISLDVATAGSAFAGIELDTNASDQLVVDEWHIGMDAGVATVSLGKQGNVWLDAPSAAAFNTIADPALGESVVVTAKGVTLGIGFEDIETNIGKVDNLQGMYTTDIGAVSVTGAVDYNMDTKLWVSGARVGAEVAGYGTGMALTYAADMWAYEADATVMGITAYLNGAEDNSFQHVGGKWETDIGGEGTNATFGTTLNYDLDNGEVSPSLNLAFAF